MSSGELSDTNPERKMTTTSQAIEAVANASQVNEAVEQAKWELQDTKSPDYSYHDDYSRISATMVKSFVRSRKKYAWVYVHEKMEGKKPNKAMDAGSVVHAVLLERKPLKEVVLEYPASCLKSNGARNPKPIAQFEADHPDFEYFLKADEIDDCRGILSELEKHPTYRFLQHEKCMREQSFFFEHKATLLPCRSQLDFVIVGNGIAYIFDLKNTVNWHPEEFSHYLGGTRRGSQLGAIQACHYSHGIERIYECPVEMRFVCVSPEKPYEIRVNRLSEDSKDVAEKFYEQQMADLSKCYETGDWTDPGEMEDNEVTLSPWDLR